LRKSVDSSLVTKTKTGGSRKRKSTRSNPQSSVFDAHRRYPRLRREVDGGGDREYQASMKDIRATALGLLLASAALFGCQSSRLKPPSAVPENLAPPANQTVSRMFRVHGVQIYDCQAGRDDPMRADWTFRAPEAELRDPGGRLIGRHYAGPTWEALDGSKIVGEVVARHDSPDPTAIPWLLLRVKSATGQGLFSQTISVQRLDTAGGKAPAIGCDQAQVGQEARVPYAADYFFYVAKPGG
jgi:Protein of unknown function (DUF3455)